MTRTIPTFLGLRPSHTTGTCMLISPLLRPLPSANFATYTHRKVHGAKHPLQTIEPERGDSIWCFSARPVSKIRYTPQLIRQHGSARYLVHTETTSAWDTWCGSAEVSAKPNTGSHDFAHLIHPSKTRQSRIHEGTHVIILPPASVQVRYIARSR